MNFVDASKDDPLDLMISRHSVSHLIECSFSKACASAELVCFDFFDTLFRRPLIKPTDLFLYMQETRQLNDFHFRRIQAEKIARRKHNNKVDIDIYEIYEYLAEAPDLEMALEEQILYPRGDIYDIFSEIQSRGLKTAVLSDVYLPKEFISKILEKHKLIPDFLYVSATDNVAKYDGSMFKAILKDSNFAPRSIIHVGDNLHSDYKIPRKFGISCYPLSNEWPQGEKNAFSGSIIEALSNSESWRASQLAAAIRDYRYLEPKDNFWSNLGGFVAGPLSFLFADWVQTQAKIDGVKAIGFVSRDGWLPMKAISAKTTDFTSHYLYCNRTIACRATLDIGGIALLRMIDGLLPTSPRKLLKQFGFDGQKILAEVHQELDSDEIISNSSRAFQILQVLKANSPTFFEEIKSEKELLVEQFSTFTALEDPKSFAIVDLGWAGSIASRLTNLIPKAVEFRYYYLGTTKNFLDERLNHKSWFFNLGLPEHHQDIVFTCVEIIESLFTASEEPIVQLKKANGEVTPIFSVPSGEVLEQSIHRKRLILAAEDFLRFNNLHQRYFPEWSQDRVAAYAILDGILVSKDENLIRNLGNILHQKGPGVSKWDRIVSVKKITLFKACLKWARGKSISKNPRNLWFTNEDLRFISSLSGIKLAIARIVYTIGIKKKR